MKKLFLIKPDFLDLKRADNKSYFCPDCVMIEGLLSFYPRLRDELDINYVDFNRPRKILVDLLGETNQSCPVLVLENGSFINEPHEIIRHLTVNHQVGNSH
ncbi:MAG: DUF3088 family protein [Prolixibacteraceae bacterium]|nr:DUF3088 family protein [Prolixibacteraceae bacterium]